MKRLFAFLLSFALLLSCCPVIPLQARAATYSGTYVGLSWELDSTTGLLTIEKGDSESGYMNPFLANSATAWKTYRSYIKSVTIGEGVTIVSSYAFEKSANLKRVTIPNTVIRLDSYAFSNCSSLTTITIPVSVENIQSNAFENCSALKDVYYLGTEQEWTSITVASGNDHLKGATIHYLADGADENTQCVVIDPGYYPESTHPYAANTKETQTFTWSGAKKLRITFSADSKVENKYDVLYVYNADGTQIAQYTGSLAGVTLDIPGDTFTVKLDADGVGQEYGYAFSAIVAYMPPPAVTGISVKTPPIKCEYWVGESIDTTGLVLTATYADGSTAEITKDFTVTDFYNYAPGRSTVTVEYEGKTASFDVDVLARGTCGINLYWVVDADYILTISGTGAMNDYLVHYSTTNRQPPWYVYHNSIVEVIIENGVQSIGEYAFYECGMLQSVTIGDSVTSIGDFAFYGCSTLKSVSIGDNVTDIGDCAFYECAGLTDVSIGNGVKRIGGSAFFHCTQLADVTIGNGVESIGDYAFEYCTKLKSVSFPDSVKTIENRAFRYCYGLTAVTIGSGMTSIWTSAFEACSELRDVYYCGTKDQWKQIGIDSSNNYLTAATLHTYVAEVSGKSYYSFKEACAAAPEAVIKLLADVENVAVEGELKLDLNGFGATNVTAEKIYAMDSSATVTAAGTGKLTTTSAVAPAFTAENVRYIALNLDGEYSFHVLEMALDKVTLRTTEAGIYYQAKYTCDPVLAANISAYGVVLSINQMPNEDFKNQAGNGNQWTVNKNFAALHTSGNGTVNTNSGGVFGILKAPTTGRTAKQNYQFAQVGIHALPYIAIGETCITAAEGETYSFLQVLAGADLELDSATVIQRENLLTEAQKWISWLPEEAMATLRQTMPNIMSRLDDDGGDSVVPNPDEDVDIPF